MGNTRGEGEGEFCGGSREAIRVRPYLADSAGPVAAGTEQVAGGGDPAQAPAAGAGGAAVYPAREEDGQKDSLSPSASCKPWGLLHRWPGSE